MKIELNAAARLKAATSYTTKVGGKSLSAPEVTDLQKAVRKYINDNDLASSDVGGRFNVFHEGKVAGQISYNGRWNPADAKK